MEFAAIAQAAPLSSSNVGTAPRSRRGKLWPDVAPAERRRVARIFKGSARFGESWRHTNQREAPPVSRYRAS